MDLLAQGLSLSAILLLSALGLTIIYGVMGVVNLAHGEFIMLGAYTMALLSASLSPWGAIVAAPLVVAAIGWCTDRALIRWLYQDPIRSMLGTFGLALVLQQTVLILYGPELRYIPLPIDDTLDFGPLTGFPAWRAVLIGFAAATAVLVLTWLRFSTAGLRLRTATIDPQIAQTLGTNVNRVNTQAFAIGAAIAGLAGALIAPLASVYPNMGTPYLVDAFLIVVLAGLNRLGEVAAWAIGVGLLTAVIADRFDDVIARLVVWGIALVIVAARRHALVPARA